MQYEAPAITERRDVLGHLGEPSGIPSDRDLKGRVEPVRWTTPTVEDRREVRGAFGDNGGRPSLRLE